ncbi:MAG: acyl carrier protein [Azospirillaceae bacterium]
MAQAGVLSGFAKRLGLGGGGAAQAESDTLSEAYIKKWLVDRLAQHMKVDPSEIDPAKSFESYGLDSRMAVRVAGELEKVVERRLSPALLFENPNIDALAKYLAEEASNAEESAED